MMNKLDNAEKNLREKIANKEEGCFITTAVCSSFGKSDDCYELMMFRKFRDTWLVNQPDGKNLIAEYYLIAPQIVDKINKLTNAAQIYQSIWQSYLKLCLENIEAGKLADCKEIYINMVKQLKKVYAGE